MRNTASISSSAKADPFYVECNFKVFSNLP